MSRGRNKHRKNRNKSRGISTTTENMNGEQNSNQGKHLGIINGRVVKRSNNSSGQNKSKLSKSRLRKARRKQAAAILDQMKKGPDASTLEGPSGSINSGQKKCKKVLDNKSTLEGPSDSNKSGKRKFQKFRDNKSKFINQRTLPTNGQTRTQKLLRTIKRRHHKITERKRKLNFSKVANTESNIQVKDLNKSKLENIEGTNLLEDNNVNEDSDCIYIEPDTIEISLDCDSNDFDAPSGSGYNEKKIHSDKIVSSTPLHPLTVTSDNGQPLFYEDRAPSTWLSYRNNTHNTLNNCNSKSLIDLSESKNESVTLSNSKFCNGDIIILDETFADSTIKIDSDDDKDIDDDVVLISDTRTHNFIPLPPDHLSNTPRFVIDACPLESNAFVNNSFFSKSEKKQLTAYSNNTYNPAEGIKNYSRKRMVIVDGSNVAYSHSCNKEFSVKGLQICLQYFEKMGHQVKAVVPQFRLQRYKSTDPISLERMYKDGKIVFTPCKNLPGKSSISSYDDRFILQLAAAKDAAIVSNDNYRDLINENSAFKKLIEKRVLGYTWCDDIFILPKDPYGRWGPTLDSILNRD